VASRAAIAPAATTAIATAASLSPISGATRMPPPKMQAPSTADAEPAPLARATPEHGRIGGHEPAAGDDQEQRRQHGREAQGGPRTTNTSTAAAAVETTRPMSGSRRTGTVRTSRALSSPNATMPAAFSAKTRLNAVADSPYACCGANDDPAMYPNSDAYAKATVSADPRNARSRARSAKARPVRRSPPPCRRHGGNVSGGTRQPAAASPALTTASSRNIGGHVPVQASNTPPSAGATIGATLDTVMKSENGRPPRRRPR
jgi:hypothetical protein